jgi:hypothetical protein
MTILIRIPLTALVLDEIVVRVWNAAAPEDFYHNVPIVDPSLRNLRPEAQAAGVG